MRSNGRFIASIIAALFVLTILAVAAFAVPKTINYQGRLADSEGTPVNGTVSMTFAIYNAPTGGELLWSETQPSVTVTDGAFSVALGSESPFTITFDEEYYLGVTVGADAEMTPRVVLVSVPYAMRAKEADSVGASSVTSAEIADGTITGADLSVPFDVVGLNDFGGVINGTNTTSTGWGPGVRGEHSATGNIGELGSNEAGVLGFSSGGTAGKFYGDVEVTGTISGDGSGLTGTTLGGKTLSELVALLDERYGGVNALVADFSGSPISIYTNQSVNFTDLSLGVPTSWLWDFGDTGTSTLQSPSYTYTAPGIYTVVLTAQDGVTSNTKSVTDYITVMEIAPDFAADRTEGAPNDTVSFTDLTQGVPISWLWDFGDTGTSTLQNPSHTYTAIGNYTVSLTAGDGVTSNTETKVDYITVQLRGTVTTVDSAGDVGQYTSIAIGADNLPVMSYYDVTNGALKVAHCGDNSCSSSIIMRTVDSAGDVGQHSSIAIGADNLPVVAYYNATSGDLKVAHCGDASCSSSNIIRTVDSVGDVGQYTSIAIGMDNLPVISYFNATSADLMVAHCGDYSCSSGNAINIAAMDSDPFVIGSFSSIAVGTDGLPAIAYAEWDPIMGSRLKVAHCGDAACSSDNTTTDAGGGSGYYSIAIGADNRPVISSTGPGLKVVHCGDAACLSGNTTTTVDSVGEWTSIAIGADDLPVISYYDGTNGNLKVAHCGNANCSSGNTITTVDSAGDVGQYTSIAIGADDLPVISYYDSTNGNFKVAKCAEATCSVW